MNARHLHAAGQIKRRQNARKRARHESFSAARWTNQQHVVTARRRNTQRAFGGFLTADAAEINRCNFMRHRNFFLQRRRVLRTGQNRHRVRQR